MSIVERARVILHTLGTDLSHAFDSVKRPKLLQILQDEGWAKDDEVRMIRFLLANTTLCVRIEGIVTRRRQTTIGVPQGDGLSGLLFIAYLASALRVSLIMRCA